MNTAKEPFRFFAASYLVRIRKERAYCLRDMRDILTRVSEACIFYHTFQSLETHHYTSFSSDFAQWVMAACNEQELAERMASVDLREAVSLEALRSELVALMDDHLRAQPASADRPAFEPFHFCEVVEFTLPLGITAQDLPSLAEGIRKISLQSLHHHFINARMRQPLGTNDFAQWVADSLGMPALAERINRIDFYTNTLEGIRSELLQVIENGAGA
jgi:hypothetical protein